MDLLRRGWSGPDDDLGQVSELPAPGKMALTGRLRAGAGGGAAEDEESAPHPLARPFASVQREAHLWGEGTPVPASEMTLDPQFAEAMVRFLSEMAGHGLTHLWTAGFLRDVISPLDTHPQGKACDITAFQFGSHVLHLRNGRPGESAWFNHTDTVDGTRTYEEVLHAITARMPSFFSRIVGPGNDRGHMGHWHVELTGANEATPIHAIRDDNDMPTDVTDRADARVPGWRTPGSEPPSEPTAE